MKVTCDYCKSRNVKVLSLNKIHVDEDEFIQTGTFKCNDCGEEFAKEE